MREAHLSLMADPHFGGNIFSDQKLVRGPKIKNRGRGRVPPGGSAASGGRSKPGPEARPEAAGTGRPSPGW